MLRRFCTHLLRSTRRCYHTSSPMYSYGVPIVIEKNGMMERAYDIYSRLLMDRIVCVMGPVTDPMASAVIAQLLFLQSESPNKPIHMYINSPGGSVPAGLAMYDTMQYVSPPVATWCMGQASSMGSLLLCAGTEGMRHALPNSMIMIHQMSSGAEGQVTDILITAEHLKRYKRQLNSLYAKHTKMDIEKIENSMERNKYFTPEEAKDFGLIDIIAEHAKSNSSDKDKEEK